MRLLLGGGLLGWTWIFLRYLDHAYPGVRPPDWDEQIARTRASLVEPGRMKVLQRMGRASLAETGAVLPDVRCPALLIAGTLDPDWANPRAEIEGIAAAMPPGTAEVVTVDGAGHYPQTQYPHEVADIILPFLRKHTGLMADVDRRAGVPDLLRVKRLAALGALAVLALAGCSFRPAAWTAISPTAGRRCRPRRCGCP